MPATPELGDRAAQIGIIEVLRKWISEHERAAARDIRISGEVAEDLPRIRGHAEPHAQEGVPFGIGEDGGGRFSSAGIEIRATPQPPEKPIVLHELIHALHARYLPNANRNADVLRFYHNALSGQLYPRGEYVVKNAMEPVEMSSR